MSVANLGVEGSVSYSREGMVLKFWSVAELGAKIMVKRRLPTFVSWLRNLNKVRMNEAAL